MQPWSTNNECASLLASASIGKSGRPAWLVQSLCTVCGGHSITCIEFVYHIYTGIYCTDTCNKQKGLPIIKPRCLEVFVGLRSCCGLVKSGKAKWLVT